MDDDATSSEDGVTEITISHTTLARFLGDVLNDITIIDETYDTAIADGASDYDLGMTPDGEVVMSVTPAEDYYHSLEYGTISPENVQQQLWYVVEEKGKQIHGSFDSPQSAQQRSAALNEQSSKTYYIRKGETLQDVYADSDSESRSPTTGETEPGAGAANESPPTAGDTDTKTGESSQTGTDGGTEASAESN